MTQTYEIVRCEDRLPEAGRSVLVRYCDSWWRGEIYVFMDGPSWRFDGISWFQRAHGPNAPTHWTELPPAPEEGS